MCFLVISVIFRHRLIQVRASTAGQLETLHKIYQRSQPQVCYLSAPPPPPQQMQNVDPMMQYPCAVLTLSDVYRRSHYAT